MRTLLSYLTLTAVLGGLLLVSPARPAQAQDATEDLTANPGYVDLQQVEDWFDTTANIEVNLQGALLNFIANSSEHSGSDFAALMRRLKSIQVRGFPMGEASEDEIMQRLDTFGEELESQGWQRVVYIREENERVNIYMRPEGESIAGLTVMTTDPSDKESVFINIVGSINPEQIGQIGSGLNIESLEEVDTSKTGNTP
jgi:hypothetical protein